MLPLSAIPSTMTNAMSRLDMVTPDVMPLNPSEISQPAEISSTQPADNSFSSMLGKMVSDVNSEENTATQSVDALQGGKNVPLQQAVIAMEEANVSFQLMVEVRNNLLNAYQEIMRMQV
jgi:flagellar hook-basal body complex protein FliE